jgi:predicted phosphoribosyltransferase
VIFKDRVDAGRQLAERLTGFVESSGLVLAIPRGGVVVGAEIARRLNLDLDLIIPRKIGSPQNPEVAIGAVTQDGSTILNQRLIGMLGITDLELKETISHEIKEIDRRTALYRGGTELKDCDGRQIVVVDDGVATGFTMLACLRSARNLHPKELILAVPVAPSDTLELLQKEVDHTVCLLTPDDFYAVGQFYERFDQTCDDEVIKIIKDLKITKE